MRPDFVDRRRFLAMLDGNQADPGLCDDLATLVPNTAHWLLEPTVSGGRGDAVDDDSLVGVFFPQDHPALLA